MIEEKNNLTTETKKFYYDSENRMVKYEHYPTDIEPADVVAEYKYDIYGRRLQKNVNGLITNFFWEGDNLSFELNQNNQPIRRYIYENGMDDVHGHVEYAEVDDPQYFSPEHKGWYSYIKDQVGTILKVYKHETKQIINTRTYDTFGNLVYQTGTLKGNLGYQSKYYDQESGLNYYYHRYYYPSIGRFINEDPIGVSDGLNIFNFVKNNPLNAIDLFGEGILEKYRDPDIFLNDPLLGIQLKLDIFTETFNQFADDEWCFYDCYWPCLLLSQGVDYAITKTSSQAFQKTIVMTKVAIKKTLSKVLNKVTIINSALGPLKSMANIVGCAIKCGDYMRMRDILPKNFIVTFTNIDEILNNVF